MNEPEPRTHGLVSYRHPADLDGEPDEVMVKSMAALADVAAVTHEVAKAALAQARNAWMDAEASAGDELSPERILAWEDESAQGRTLKAVVKTAEYTRKAGAQLARHAANRP